MLSDKVFQRASVLCAVLVAFIVVRVWEQFGDAVHASGTEESARRPRIR